MEHPAVTEYLRREAEANATPQGANHTHLIEQVARDFEMPAEELSLLVMDATSTLGAG